MVDHKSPLTDKAVRKVATHPSESSGHWYDQHGQQIAEVTGAKGQPVRPDLRHARKLGLCRGVTSIIGLAAAPQLELWKVRQGILSALTLPRGDTESEGDWMARVEQDMKETAAKAAEAGTALHASIQASIQGQPFNPEHAASVNGALAALDAVCGFQAWRAEVCVVSPLGFGAKLDLLSDEWLIDWKSKDTDAKGIAELDIYEQHHMQLAAGLEAAGGLPRVDDGIPRNLAGRRAAIGFISRTHPGVARVVEVDVKQLVRGFSMFRGLLEYSFAKDSYRPAWAKDLP